MTAEIPLNPGDRAYGHGDQVTFDFDGEEGDSVEKGDWVEFHETENMTVVLPDDTEPSYDAVVKHAAEAGEKVTVHLRGVVRAKPEAHDYPVVQTYDDDNTELVVLR